MKTIAEAMAEKGIETPVVPETTPEVTPEVTPEAVETPAEDTDIVNRVTKAETPVVESSSQEDTTETKFNTSDIEKIEDPVARKYAEDAYKSLQGDYTRKSQQLAEDRKAMETELADSSKWTPQKIQALLSNEEFVSATQAVLDTSNPTDGEMSDDEWSALNPKEKTEIKLIQKKVNDIERSNQQVRLQADLDRQVTDLSTKYTSFSKDKVLGLLNDVNAGKFSATLEHIHKVVDYEPAIRRAYQLGLDDKKLEVTDKSNASTVADGNRVVTPTTDVAPKEGETPKQFLMRRISERLEQKNKK